MRPDANTALDAIFAAEHPSLEEGPGAEEARPSDHTLDRLLAGELSPAEAAAVRACCAEEEELRAVLAEREQSWRAFAARALPPELQAAPPAPRRPWGGLVAAAAAVVLGVGVVGWPGPSAPEPGEVLRTKGGGAVVTPLLVEGGEARPLGPEARLRAGDRVQLTVRSGWPVHVGVLGRDGAGVVQQLYPPAGEASGALGGGGERTALPVSLRFDDSPGPETLAVVTCAAGFDPAPLAAQLAAGAELGLAPGCAEHRWTWEKE